MFLLFLNCNYWRDDGDSDITDFILSIESVTVSHIWNDIGSYIITAKTEYEIEKIGPKATITITIP